MSYRLGLIHLKQKFLFLFVTCTAVSACSNTFHAYHSEHLPGRLKVIAIPGSCYYYVKDKLTGMCWLSCFDQSMIADEDCKYYDKAFSGRKLEGAQQRNIEKPKQASTEEANPDTLKK